MIKRCKNCYPQVLLEECKYIVKGNKVTKLTKYINENLEISSDDSDYSDKK